MLSCSESRWLVKTGADSFVNSPMNSFAERQKAGRQKRVSALRISACLLAELEPNVGWYRDIFAPIDTMCVNRGFLFRLTGGSRKLRTHIGGISMGNQKTGSIGTAFAMAAVWFATHSGGGFATGNQEVNYFVKFGWYSIFLPIVAMLLLGWGHRNAMVLAKDHKTYDYKSFGDVLFHPYEKYFSRIFEFGFIMLIACGVSISIAGSGSLLQSSLGIPYGVGIVAVGFAILLLTIFGSQLIVRALSYKTYFLIITLLILCVLGIQMGAFNFQRVLAAKETFGASFTDAIWATLVYIGFQAFTVLPIISVSQNITTTKECNQFMFFGTLLNGLFLAVVCVMLLGFTPEVLSQTLPVYFVCAQLNLPWLKILYSTILFVALFGTAISLVFSTVARFEPVLSKKAVFTSVRSRRIAISLITIAICTGISVFGLTNIVVKGYGSVGYIGLFFVLLPEIVVGTIKIRNNARARKEQELTASASNTFVNN